MPAEGYAEFKVKEGKYKDATCYAKYYDWLNRIIVDCYIEYDYETAIQSQLMKTNMELINKNIEFEG